MEKRLIGDDEPALFERIAYSVDEASKATGLGRTTLYGLMSAGRLRSCKIGNRRLIRAQDLMALIDQA